MSSSQYQPGTAYQISHELRIPLVGIIGMAELLSETPLNSEQRKYLSIIEAAAKRLLAFENQLHNLLDKGI